MNKSIIGLPTKDVFIRNDYLTDDYLTDDILNILSSNEFVTNELAKRLEGKKGCFYKTIHETDKWEMRKIICF